ncbi:MAG: hypothetical protein KZQ70_04455 [gamma proteobacterium symbiont of Lucinoma myriamae]|nr:hypothetical protein [gamma proteobacterium symbiont of Lucinoma myriamae]MCU7818717.1 hypothetical protein [gamma proteobacterium symbiont of Lucinoma myriamae]MCU7831839.1 hypothetical protein [gamma proteobacterium symbiont of Lucinoma myriamae]
MIIDHFQLIFIGSGQSLLSVELMKPRQARITAGSSGISDVPESIRQSLLSTSGKTMTRLTILDATFSY